MYSDSNHLPSHTLRPGENTAIPSANTVKLASISPDNKESHEIPHPARYCPVARRLYRAAKQRCAAASASTGAVGYAINAECPGLGHHQQPSRQLRQPMVKTPQFFP
jgi:hypothetical protein